MLLAFQFLQNLAKGILYKRLFSKIIVPCFHYVLLQGNHRGTEFIQLKARFQYRAVNVSAMNSKISSLSGKYIFQCLPGIRRVHGQERQHGDHAHDYTTRITLDGNLPRLAPWRTGAELRWEGGNWRAGIGAIRHARQDRVAEYEEQTPGYTLVNANLAWHLDTRDGQALELFVDGSNLLDEEARPHTSLLKDLSPLPGRGIAFGVRAFF